MRDYVPFSRASETSSLVTFSARNIMAMFCDFLGSSTLLSFSAGGRTDFLVASFGTEFAELHPKSDSIMSSFNLQYKRYFFGKILMLLVTDYNIFEHLLTGRNSILIGPTLWLDQRLLSLCPSAKAST